MPIVCKEGFRNYFGDVPESTYFCPGRINLIGEHTDYSGGLVLSAAIQLGMSFAVRRNDRAEVRVFSEDFDQHFTIALNDLVNAVPDNHWKDYFVGVLSRLARDQYTGSGLDVFVSSSLPIGGGLSSSASVTTGFAFVLCDVWGLFVQGRALALMAQQVENEFVGVNCGILDPFSVVMGQDGQLIELDCSTLSMRYVPFPAETYQVVSVDSGVSRNLAESNYNIRRDECEQALSAIKKHVDVGNLSELTVAGLDRMRGEVDAALFRRVRHIVAENARVRAAVEALLVSDMREFGRLLAESHQSLRDDFEVSCPELDILVEESLRIPGVIGAKMTGAGFGGCIVAVVNTDDSDRFIDELSTRYRRRTQIEAGFYFCEPAQGVRRTSEDRGIGKA